jgi:hypothetical protein
VLIFSSFQVDEKAPKKIVNLLSCPSLFISYLTLNNTRKYKLFFPLQLCVKIVDILCTLLVKIDEIKARAAKQAFQWYATCMTRTARVLHNYESLSMLPVAVPRR